ncbi:MAG: glycosyltransferase [Woeseia sp.]
MQFIVFSYNRGEFLDNCVASIEHCAPGSNITIFDDNSDNEGTRHILQTMSLRHEVVYGRPVGGAYKHGGLYQNMQAAFERLDPDSVFCFLQDDTQLVRKITSNEVSDIAQYFDSHEHAGFIQPAFFKGSNRHSDQPLTRFDPAKGGYFVDRLARSAGAFYSDILIARKSNLLSVRWRFLDGESVNEKQSRRKLKQLIHLRNPFAAWLPYVPAYRGKRLTLALRMGQKLSRSGLYPFRYMSYEERGRFLYRDPSILPFAEDFLSTSGPPLRQPWIYHPLQGRRMLKLLHGAEVVLRRPWK